MSRPNRPGRLAAAALAALGIAVGAAGCGPPQAPVELDALTRFLYAEWDHEDPVVMEGAIKNLHDFLGTRNLTESLNGRSWRLTPLTREDLAGVPFPMDRDPANCLGSSVARSSKWPVEDHLKLQLAADHVPWEPTAKSYVRHIVEPLEPACFAERRCPLLLTDNDITRDNAALSVNMMIHKNYRWVKMPDGASFALVARSYIERSFPGNKSGTAIHQTYASDIWMPRADGTTWRYQALYQETELAIAVDDGITLATITTSTDGAFRAGDEQIGKMFHGEM